MVMFEKLIIMNKYFALVVVGTGTQNNHTFDGKREGTQVGTLKEVLQDKKILWEYDVYKSAKKIIVNDLAIYGKNKQSTFGKIFSESSDLPYVIHKAKVLESIIHLDTNMPNEEIWFIVSTDEYYELKNNLVFQKVFTVNDIKATSIVHSYNM